MSPLPFRVGQLSREGWLQGSKWLTFRLLIDSQEMEEFISFCGEISMVNVAEVVSEKTALISRADFLSCYQSYVTSLAKGLEPKRSSLRPFFSLAWTASKEALCAFSLSEDRWMVKPISPVVQLSHHFFLFSPENQRFHSMACGHEGISWGLQFSYPQLYARSAEGKAHFSAKGKQPNGVLLQRMKQWIRQNTRPTRFFFQKQQLTAVFRISRRAAAWMADYPLLKQLGLELRQ